jgi:hypothetical protein
LSSVNAVVNQEAQRREAPLGIAEVPPSPPLALQKEYGTPIQRPIQPIAQNYGPPANQRRLHAMQRIIAAMRAQQAGGYASQGRVVNRPRPIPLQKPLQYGPPHAGGHSSSSSSSGSVSLQAFTHNHTPGVSCEGWIPISGPSFGAANSASGAASIGANVDTSYGPPPPVPSSSGGHAGQGTLIVVPDTYGPPPQYSSSGHASSSIDTSYGVPSPPQNSYGPPPQFSSSSGHASSSIDTSYGVPSPPQNSYGPPPQFSSSGHASSSIDTSYGVPSPPQNSYGPPPQFSSSSGHASSSIDTSYGVPSPPQNSYGPPPQFSSSGHASSIASIDSSYEAPLPPQIPHKEYGVPKHLSSGESAHSIQTPDIPPQPIPIEYGPPVIVGSGHASSATAIEQTYGAPVQPAPVIEISSSQGIDSSYQQVGHQSYGLPSQPIDSYGPPPSGLIHGEDVRHGHSANIETIQSVGSELQLPEINSNIAFSSNDIGIGVSALGVSAGNSEVIKSHAIHESHTSEVSSSIL